MVDPALDVIGKPKSARMASILPGRSFEDFELSTPRTSQRRNQASHELGPIVPRYCCCSWNELAQRTAAEEKRQYAEADIPYQHFRLDRYYIERRASCDAGQ